MNSKTIVMSLVAMLSVLTSCKADSKQSAGGEAMRGNQLGFIPSQFKMVVVPKSASPHFSVVNTQSNTTVLEGSLSVARSWVESGDVVSLADFSSIRQAGTYELVVEKTAKPFAFIIRDNVYKEALKASIKAYYFNRASAALTSQYAGKYHRPASHPDTVVYVHDTAATTSRPAGTVLSLPKGWFDAGDFGKYTVNSSIAVYTLLAALERFPKLFNALSLNIPESANAVPDLLDEIVWNLDWMESMQDLDGGVYHKLTTERFAPLTMPHAHYKPRFVVQKTTAATLNFVSTFAYASRIFSDFEQAFPGRAARYRKAAFSAWQWAIENPEVIFEQPKGFNTGHYKLPGDNYKDEWLWARAELFSLTGEEEFLEGVEIESVARVPEWSDVETLGLLTLAKAKQTPDILRQKSLESLISSADKWQKDARDSGYGVSMRGNDFRWGSNGVAANKAMSLLEINYLFPNEAYVKTAQSLLDYLLGRNPLGKSYLSGFGRNSLMHPHHRVSESDDVEAPVPGMLAGGPHTGHQDKDECQKYGITYEHTIPARSYVDHWCSYATNEVAINWNAPLVYVLAYMTADIHQ